MHVLGTMDLKPHIPPYISVCRESEIESRQMSLMGYLHRALILFSLYVLKVLIKCVQI